MQSISSKSQVVPRLLCLGGLAAATVGMSDRAAFAQVTINTTGTVSGTIQLPSFNPNFNKSVTRVNTDASGTYYRSGAPVYTSNYVKVQTRPDGSLNYYVDFKGIPVISFDGVITSPALSGGRLQPYTYQGKLPGTLFQAVVQDEFGIKKAFYTGTVTDPSTGKQYNGTFQLNGQGPRYSDSNGGTSPTVFDFKSDIPGTPTVTSLTIKDVPLVRLTIMVPADAVPITGSMSGSTPASGGSTPASSGSTTPSSGNSIPTTGATSPAPTDAPVINFSSGQSLEVSRVVLEPSTLNSATCTTLVRTGTNRQRTYCKVPQPSEEQPVGPRSRVLLR